MNTPLLNRLRQHLASISAEQFQAEWAEIEAMGFEGISVDEFLKTSQLAPTISQIKSGIVHPALNDFYGESNVGNFSFAMAA